MIVKLAYRNVISKVGRTLATVVAVAISIAAIFLILSFKDAIYDYISRTPIANSGTEYGVHIKYSPNGDKTITIDAAKNHEEVEDVSPTLEFYWLFNNEYVSLRGFQEGKLDSLNAITAKYGSMEDIKYSDDVIISYSTAKYFNLRLGDTMIFKGTNNVEYPFTVAVIAEDTGYFGGSGIPVVITNVKGISRIIIGSETEIYNNLYVKAKPGVSNADLVRILAQEPKFEKVIVEQSIQYEKIQQNATSFAATVQMVGVAVMILAVFGIGIILLLSTNEKRDYIAKLSIIGASKKQIAGIFLLELAITALFGMVVGVGFAAGLHAAVLFALAGSLSMYKIIAWKMIVSLIIGFVLTMVFGSYPMLKAFKGTVRDNITDSSKKTPLTYIVPSILGLLTVVSMVLSFTVRPLYGIMGIIALVLVILDVAMLMPAILKLSVKPFVKNRNAKASIRVAAMSITKNKQSVAAGRLLAVGLVAIMLMFGIWKMTTTVFTGYTNDFKNIVFVTNTTEEDRDILVQTEGVEKAFQIYWGEAKLITNKGKEKAMRLVGAANVLDVFQFDFVTPRSEIETKIDGDHYIFIDKAFHRLNGVDVGDMVTITIEGKEKQLEVGGILSSPLFVGNYIIVPPNTLLAQFDIKTNNTMITTKSDTTPTEVVNIIRSKYAGEHNYYAAALMDMYKFDISFLNNVFLMIGILAGIIMLMIAISLSSSDMVAHALRQGEREMLMCAGMSKKMLFSSELIEHILIGTITFVVSFAALFALYAALLNAIALFGLYFEIAWPIFLQNIWVVIVVGFALSAYYSLLPIIFAYKKVYKLRAR